MKKMVWKNIVTGLINLELREGGLTIIAPVIMAFGLEQSFLHAQKTFLTNFMRLWVGGGKHLNQNQKLFIL